MPKYEASPEEAEASLRESGEAIFTLENALAVAEERSEQLEQEIGDAFDIGDSGRQASLEAEMERVQQEIQNINTDLEGANQHHIDNQTFWGF
ncbi:hypothetical protein SAMN05428970_2387 [Agromyces sp. CF514]|uniref:hypothetical protein n=1 Tax=Agromyces sp. CF514 TaxID=1881031 RepID=UPI0008E2615B|nr:hypothetical protein [Agromyces sp. CF514]SFR78460.1 hypothetical protein SAMN05428970_2387 [Agromyces sp. CF514]